MADMGDGVPIQVLPPIRSERMNLTYETLLRNMDWAGVDAAVLLQDPCYGDWSDYVIEACNKYPDRFIASAYFDPWVRDAKILYENHVSPYSWKLLKLECSTSSGLCGVYKGIKIFDDIPWLYDFLEREGRTVTFDLGQPGTASYQTEQIIKISKAHPNLKIVICHLGQPSSHVEEDMTLFSEWKKQISLSLRENIWFDYSALPFHVPDEEYPFPSTKRYIMMALEIIGSEKLMWGTDVPWLLGYATYKQYAQLAKKQLEEISPLERAKILGETAKEVYWGKE
jgi:predicted TIM-barrel fold metal-dependent hydrolase